MARKSVEKPRVWCELQVPHILQNKLILLHVKKEGTHTYKTTTTIAGAKTKLYLSSLGKERKKSNKGVKQGKCANNLDIYIQRIEKFSSFNSGYELIL